ncbi:MAG TPA: hypothetical protein VK595_06350 [Vicinamibacterales bacterium]|nr:hypothetical protein [Vicinamibacterales bacterium]
MMSAAAEEHAVAAAEADARDRRTHRRLAPSELAWIREVRLKFGPKVSLIDLSTGGALLQTDVRLRPGSDLVIEIVGSRIEAVPFRVLRSELARISNQGAIYQGACEFKRPLDLATAQGRAGRGEPCDVALKKLMLRRRHELSRKGHAIMRQSDKNLPQLLRSVQGSARSDDPLSRGLRDLLAEIVPALDRGEPAVVLRSRLEDRLRRALPRAAIAIGSAQQEAGPGTETIYFSAEGVDGPGVLNVQLPEGTRIPDWEFRLLQSASHLLELLPAATAIQSEPPTGGTAAPAAPHDYNLDLLAPPMPGVSAGWQKIVVRYRDGRLLKGFTHDFHPSRTQFSLWPSVNSAPSERMYVPTSQLKAVFFVRNFEGNPEYTDDRTFDTGTGGRRLEVTFADDEVLIGSTLSYRPDGVGFFVNPADSRGNNLRVFVVASAIRHVRFL